MPQPNTLTQSLLSLLRRVAVACFGLVLYGLGTYLQLQANMGQSPWTALNQGLSIRFPMTYGTASILIGVVVIGLDLLLREPIGLGTILNVFIIGLSVDFFDALDLIPVQTAFLPQLALLLAGIVIVCISQYFYMKPGLSCGPRDGFMVAVGRRVPRVPIGVVTLVVFAVVLGLSILLGSPVGPGTLIATFGTGPITDAVFHVLRFEPRDVRHEGLGQTIASLRAAR